MCENLDDRDMFFDFEQYLNDNKEDKPDAETE